MNDFYINKRKTARQSLNIKGLLTIIEENKCISEEIEIIDISYQGMQVVFSSNSFLMNYLKAYKDTKCKIEINFKYEEKDYKFNADILWFRLYELGERNFYTASGIIFQNAKKEEEILEILLDIELDHVYLG